MKKRYLAIVVCMYTSAWSPCSARTIEELHGFEPHFVMPANAGMVNIRDLGAVGDGVTDDTEAFRKAFEMDQPRAIYIPNGTYLINQQIRYGVNDTKKKKVCVMGESRSGTIIKLADDSPGFGDPKKPLAFIHARHPRQQGEQNMHNYFYHLTIEIGRGNPGAIALNYHSNNTGAVKDVTIRTSDPIQHPGHIGLGLLDWNTGPANARYVTVEGFDTGIAIEQAGNYFTMEHITVARSRIGVVCGIASIRDLVVRDCVVPLVSKDQTVLIGADLQGEGEIAIDNRAGGLMAREVNTRGFHTAIVSNNGPVATGPDIDLYLSESPKHSFGMPPHGSGSLRLPVEESPEIQYPQLSSEWVVMPPRGDLTGPLQAAIDTGVRHIFIPAGNDYMTTSTVILRGNVERIMGVGNAYIKHQTGEEPAFRLEEGSARAVIIELIYAGYGSNTRVTFEQAAARTWVLRHGSGTYRTDDRGRGARVFIESLVGSPLEFRNANAWVRDVNTELGGPTVVNILNEEGSLWILGQKTEDFATMIKTVRGTTELLGGVFRQNWDQADFDRSGIKDDDRPALFVAVDADVALTYVASGPAKSYESLVRETRSGQTQNLLRSEYGGSAVLFVGQGDLPTNGDE